MKFTKKNIQKSNRNGVLIVNNANSTSTININGSNSNGNFLPATSNGDGTYTVNLDKVHFNGNLSASGEVTAHKLGSGGSVNPDHPNIIVYDGLDSTDPKAALSANQGRILKGLIDSKSDGGGGNANMDDYYNKSDINSLLLPKADTEYVDKKVSDLVNGAPETMDTLKELSDALKSNSDTVGLLNDAIVTKANVDHKHTKSDITDLDLTSYDQHILDNTKHITSAERIKWNNKLDKSVWDKAFYYDSKNNLRVKLNLISDKEVAAYGKGDLPSGGTLTIIDSLNSYSTNAALSANQGRILKELIDTKTLDVDLTDYYKKSDVDTLFQPRGNYLTSIPSEYITEIELNNKGYLTSSSLNGYAKTSQIPTKVSQLTNDKNYLTSHQSLTHLANKDGSNVSGTWGISITGTASNSNKLGNKSASQYVTTDTNQTITANKDFTGYLKIKGTAAERHLVTRGIGGYNPDGDKIDDVYINYGTGYGLKFGRYGEGYLKGDGSIDSKSIKATGTITSTGDIYASSNKKVWHTGNLEVSNNIKQKYDIDLKSLPNSNFYPVYFTPSMFELDCEIHSPAAGAENPYNQNHIHFLMTSKGWADTYSTLKILSHGNYDNNEITIGSIGRGNENGGIAVWLRGGMTYTFTCNRVPNLKKGNFKDGNEFYAYGTQLWGGANKTVSILWKNDTTRDNYQLIHYKDGLKINGNITATGEVTAYATNAKTLEETPVTMALADENPRVYDGLDSTDPKVALSANQGYILMNTIKDLQKQIDSLKAQINELSGQ